MENIAAHEARLLEYATARLSAVDGLSIVGTAAHKAGVISFTMEGMHPNDIGTIIDHYGVAIRTGHHCAMPAVKFFGLSATCRASLGAYNTAGEVDVLADALGKAREMLA
jgi:cysteine desulfurase/selenocysteine lyase